MDFIVGLHKTSRGYNSIWVIVDRLAKLAHFLPMNKSNSVLAYDKLYIARILSLHGVPKTIVSDRGPQCHGHHRERSPPCSPHPQERKATIGAKARRKERISCYPRLVGKIGLVAIVSP
jgi:hypothetical protein